MSTAQQNMHDAQVDAAVVLIYLLLVPMNGRSGASSMNRDEMLRVLGSYEPFDRLEISDLEILAARSELIRIRAGERIFEEGSSDNYLIYLHTGSVMLERTSGRKHQVDAGTPAAKLPLSRLKPRQFGALATTPLSYFRIDESGLGDLYAVPEDNGYAVEEVIGWRSDSVSGAEDVQNDLASNEVKLPTLPNVALQTIKLIDHDDVSVATLGQVVMTDPSIAAKLMRAANSALFHGRGEVRSAEKAIQRLGIRATRQLVVAFALREVFHVHDKSLRGRMEQVWDHSTHVAALSMVLAAEMGGYDPDEAQLAGLLQQVGAVPVLNYASSRPDLAANAERVDWLIHELGPGLGERILQAWNFPQPMVDVARNVNQWWRDPGPTADLTDVVLVAQMASYIGTPRFATLPPMFEVPAFAKTVGAKLEPTAFMAVLKGAEKQIQEARSILSM